MPSSSHTTARSASLPTSRGRAARRGEADAAILGKGQARSGTAVRDGPLLPYRRRTTAGDGATIALSYDRASMDQGSGERPADARTSISDLGRDRSGPLRPRDGRPSNRTP